jgi:disulfide oxidoreductase YuzD
MNPSILEYVGLINDGVLVLISIVWNEKYYEATFYYTDKDILLTASEELEKDLGHEITKDENYIPLIKVLLRKIVPYDEIRNKLDPVNFDRWIIKD